MVRLLGSGTLKDIFVVAASALLIYVLGSTFGIFELVHKWLEQNEAWNAHAIVDVAAIAGTLTAFYLVNRRRALRREIETRQRGEEALERERDSVATVLATVDSLVIVLDTSARIVRFNLAAEVASGYSAAEAAGRRVWEIFPLPPDKAADPEAVVRLKTQAFPADYESDFVNLTGDRLIIRWTISSLPTGNSLGHVVCTGIDVTKQRQIEAAQRESEAKFRELFHRAYDAMFLHKVTDEGLGNFIEVNDAACRRLGYSHEELFSLSPADIDDPACAPDIREAVEKMLAEGAVTFEVTHLAKDGRRLPVEISARYFSLGDERVVLSAARDISTRKQTEGALRESEERFRRLVEFSPDMVIVNQNERLAYVNPAGCRLLGVASPAELLGRQVWDFVHPDFRQVIKERVRRALESDGHTPLAELTYLRADGTPIQVEASSVAMTYNGAPAVQSIIRDISERKRAEQAQRESEERYRRLVEMSPEGILVHRGGPVLFVNSAMCALLGTTDPTTIIGRDILEIVSSEQHELVRERIKRMMTNGDEVGAMEQKYIRLDGTLVDVEVSSCLVPFDGERSVLTFARDITDRKRAELALHEANDNLSAWVTELELRENDSTILREMSELLQASLTTDEAYPAIGRAMGRLFPRDSGALYVLRHSRDFLEATAAWGEGQVAERLFAPNECWGLRLGRPHAVTEREGGMACQHVHADEASRYHCVPLAAQGDTLGLLHLRVGAPAGEGRDELPERKRQRLLAVADLVGPALANLNLRQTLRDQAIRDPLTGLFNRRYLEETLEREVSRADRQHNPLAMVMMDIDHFKHLNDLYGHDAGDAVLTALGRFLRQHLRQEDISCRYGGEEFALILPEASLVDAYRRAEELRRGIGAMAVEYRGRQLGPVRVSIGLACYPDHGRGGTQVLKAADIALYRAKAEGRDRTIVAGASVRDPEVATS